MTARAASRRLLRTLACAVAAVVLTLGSGSHPGHAALTDAFSGYVDLMAIQSEAGDLRSDFVRQEYNGVFSHRLTPSIDLRAAVRYFDFDQDQEAILSGYRSEFQPTGEVRWSNPWFAFGASYLQRQVQTQVAETDFVTESGQVSVQTRNEAYPLFALRYDEQHSYETDSRGDEDVRSRRLLFTADQTRGNHVYSYSFHRVRNQNVISGIEAGTNRHLARWSGAGYADDDRRLRLSGNFSLNYSDRNSAVTDGGRLLELQPVAVGLYALDETPDLGPLAPLTDLSDDDTEAAVQPLISIGGADVDRNIGADLARPEAVAGVYVYTDRPSGPQVRWRVYGSLDNESWTLLSGTPAQIFNATLNRYEILFPFAGNVRYVKVVNAGLNDVIDVYVTEIQVLKQILVVDGGALVSVIKMFDGRAAYQLRPDLRTSLDVSAQHDRTPAETGNSRRFDYAWRLMFDRSPNLHHQIRWEQARQSFSGDRENTRESTMAYSVIYQPLPLLRGSLAVSERMTDMGGKRTQDSFSTSGEASGSPISRLDLSLGLAWGRTTGYGHGPDRNSWSFRFGLDAELKDNLTLFVNQTHQETRTRAVLGVRARRLYDLGFDWRLTSRIFARMSAVYAVDESRNITEDVLLTWNLTDSLRFTAQHYGVRRDEILTTDRNNVSVNLDLGAQSNVYFRLSEVDLSGGGGERTLAFQQGFRLGF